ncbi:hypothetical protein GEMRC1_006512 [Eukaryota sp. GEM-RC1]
MYSAKCFLSSLWDEFEEEARVMAQKFSISDFNFQDGKKDLTQSFSSQESEFDDDVKKLKELFDDAQFSEIFLRLSELDEEDQSEEDQRLRTTVYWAKYFFCIGNLSKSLEYITVLLHESCDPSDFLKIHSKLAAIKIDCPDFHYFSYIIKCLLDSDSIGLPTSDSNLPQDCDITSVPQMRRHSSDLKQSLSDFDKNSGPGYDYHIDLLPDINRHIDKCKNVLETFLSEFYELKGICLYQMGLYGHALDAYSVAGQSISRVGKEIEVLYTVIDKIGKYDWFKIFHLSRTSSSDVIAGRLLSVLERWDSDENSNFKNFQIFIPLSKQILFTAINLSFQILLLIAIQLSLLTLPFNTYTHLHVASTGFDKPNINRWKLNYA